MKVKLIKKALEAMVYSYSPYSKFRVGAALLSDDGEIFTGCNVEGVSYGNAICAERTALVKAVSSGKQKFTMLAVVSDSDDFCMPCGICRQMLYEFSPDMLVLCGNNKGEFRELTLSNDLLPNAFSSAF